MLPRAALFLLTVPLWSQSLTYSTYLRNRFVPASIATDAAGGVYLAGYSVVDPLTQQIAPMVIKLDPTGQRVIYSRILGGSFSDSATSIAVDQAGDAYIVGSAISPDFPVTPGRALGTLPARSSDPRTFLIKLDPQGDLLFSETIGAVSSSGQAVALAPQGGILVSGMSNAKGFASTSGAYSVPDTGGRPYLMDLSSDGSQVVFAATGIGGSALAVDSSGNIFMAGSTALTDYPTTAGAYQTTFKSVYICYGFCQIGFPGADQYVTKVDPAATKLLYSTGVAGTGSTTNSGLAVDAGGNAYVTGIVQGGGTYPYTVAPGPGAVSVQPFVTKLDPTGSLALYSIPIGGAGIALSGNNLLVGGSYNSLSYGNSGGLPLAGPPAGVANLNSACQVNNLITGSQAYVSQLDVATGNVLNTVLVDSTDNAARGIALAGGSAVWLAGTTLQADVPITAGAVVPAGLTAGVLPGSTLAQIDFAAVSPANAPQLGCMLDGANMLRVGPVAPNQLVTLMGANLASAAITFDGQPATVLYSSSSQINLAVPYSVGSKASTTMELSFGSGAAITRELPVVPSEPALFASITSGVSCPLPSGEFANGFPAVARNQDGSANACNNPARAGSIVSLFLNGLGGQQAVNVGIVPLLPAEIPISVSLGEWSAEVVNVAAENQYVWRVDVLVPPVTRGEDALIGAVLNTLGGPLAVGPLTPELPAGSIGEAGTPLPVSVWIAP